MSKYLIAGILVLSGVLFMSTRYYYNRCNTLESKLSTSISNEKALLSSSDALLNKNRVLQLTIEQFQFVEDSLTSRISEIQKELDIKDKNLKQIQYLLSEAQRKATIVFRVTLFRDSFIKIDTVLGDQWYQLNVGLEYPNTLMITPKFVSEKYIITNYRKETINPPKKCWLFRLFQKKHKVVEVNIIEKNPHIENKQQRFIEIVK